METTVLYNIAEQFCIEGVISAIEPLGEGFINDTFIVRTSGQSSPNYILQRKNKNIFKDIPAMMENIERVTLHLKDKISAKGGDSMREAMTVVRTKGDKLYFKFWSIGILV